jgi:primosomal protein N' (replication factor Y)
LKYISVAFPIPVNKPFYYKCEEDVQIGSRVKVPFGRFPRAGYVVDKFDEEPEVSYPLKGVKEVIDEESLIPPQLMKLARSLSEYYLCSMGEILSVILPLSLSLKRKRNIDSETNNSIIHPDYDLLPDQKKVIEPIIKKAAEHKFGKFLIHGVTDSGKTEVYMRVASSVIEMGKQVIVLVPEIAITAQLREMFENRFGSNNVGIWHSKITKSQKLTYIEKMSTGELKVMVGPRSAVFAPFAKLGAIIIDEEQDSSYKNGSTPFYDARFVAEKRCESQICS